MEYCVCCGAPIPEGGWICWRCKSHPELIGSKKLPEGTAGKDGDSGKVMNMNPMWNIVGRADSDDLKRPSSSER